MSSIIDESGSSDEQSHHDVSLSDEPIDLIKQSERPLHETVSSPAPSLPRPGNISATAAEPLPRLAIHSLQLINFKSYGGTVYVGPFHKNFSAIVGPNGSGKSNVIDAMLFVFGRPAKHLRHSKVSELIHNSAALQDVSSTTVKVFFHDIVDTGDGDDDFTVLPNSEFSVSRTAFRNNTSKYFLDKNEVKRKDVVDLLKSKGVDLDNNRFLILQGEVEQISLMKPKAMSAHDTGLLEYLEDIIGSNRFIEQIEQNSNTVECLNEERGHKMQRVKAAERERDALENAKTEAEDYLDKERDMLNKKGKLNKSQQFDTISSLKNHSKSYDEAKLKVEQFSSEVKSKESNVSLLEQKFKDIQKHESKAVQDLNDAKESYAAYERKDIKLREDMKALKAKKSKLKGVVAREEKRANENNEKAKSFFEDKEKAEKNMAEAESVLKDAQAAFDETRDEVKRCTHPIRERLEKKQEELLPFSEAINEARKNLQLSESSAKILEEKLEEPKRNLNQAVQSLQVINSDLQGAKEKLRVLQSDYDEQKLVVCDTEKELANRRSALENMSSSLSGMRRRVEEARSARDFSSTRSKLHNAVLSASRSGRLQGVVGRLGDLASVDQCFETAVSAAAGANLDCIVVHTAEDAQACIQFLRRENLGRSTFIILDKIGYLRAQMESWSRSDRKNDGRRLFNYLRIPNRQNETALYYSLRDTLVANSLDEARRIAFKPTRQNRVVTTAGELIESTGAMTGGGRGPTKYRLGSGGTGDGEMDEVSFRKLCDDAEGLKAEVQQAHGFIDSLDLKKRSALSRLEEIEAEISKCQVEVSSLASREENLKKNTIPSLEKTLEGANNRVRQGNCEITRKYDEAKKAVDISTKQLASAKEASKDIERAIEKLQEDILAAGGCKLEDTKTNLETCRSKVNALQSEISTASSRAAAAQKIAEKAKDAVEAAQSELEQTNVDYEKAKEASEAMLDNAANVAEKIETAEKVHSEWSEKLNEIQTEYANVKDSLKSLRRKEVSLVEESNSLQRLVSQDTHHLKILKKEGDSLSKKLRKLSLMGIPSTDDVDNTINDGAEAKDDGNDQDPMSVDNAECDGEDSHKKDHCKDSSAEDDLETFQLSPSDKGKLEAEIGALESELSSLSPNLDAIAEYAEKDLEYRGQVDELDDVTKRRDETRRECDRLRKARLDEFMNGFSTITLKLKELYQMITLGGDAELELVDSLDPFSEGIVFSVRPPKKSWKNICNLSGGEKTLSSLALVFALHHFKPTPLYFLDEIDAALDYKNVSIVGNYVKERTKDAQFIIISLRNNMFELADRLVGIYKTHHITKSVTINPRAFVMPCLETTQVTRVTQMTQPSS